MSSEKKTVCERGCFNQLRDIMRRIGGVYSEEEASCGGIRLTWKKNVGGVLSIFGSNVQTSSPVAGCKAITLLNGVQVTK